MKKVTLAVLFLIASVVSFSANSALVTVGDLPGDGSSQLFIGDITPGDLDMYAFTLGGDIMNGDGSFLNIQTFGDDGFDLMDTIIALYSSAGDLIAVDDDGANDDTFTVFYSYLTFGDSDIFTSVDTNAGEDGLLMAGDYIAVVAGFRTNFTPLLSDLQGNNFATIGDYILQITAQTTSVSAPASMLIFATGLIALLRLSRQARI